MKLKNKMLQEENAELQSRLNTANKQVNRKLILKYRELKDKIQHDTAVKVGLVCMYNMAIYNVIATWYLI